MHYRNGREAKNGDKVIQFETDSGMPLCIGTLEGAEYGQDFCNGRIEVPNSEPQLACLCDCLHVDDVAELLGRHGLDKRPMT